MNRRQFLAGTAASAAAAMGRKARGANARRRPNIIFIMTDDQKRETFGFLEEGRGKAHTPHINSLAEQGVYFNRAYVSSSVCTPSRYSTLTGQYASRCKNPQFLGNSSREGQTRVTWNTFMEPGDPNLAKALQAVGYATGFVGKGHCYTSPNYDKPPKGLDASDPRVTKILAENQRRQIEACKAHGFDYAASLYQANILAHSHPAVEYHNMDWVAKGALDFLDEYHDRPFFLYMATTLHHGPSPSNSFEKNDRRNTEAGLLSEPLTVLPSNEDILRRVKAAGCPEKMAYCTWLDDGVGAVLNKLEELGIAENTVVFYLNDHGVEQGKSTLYEGGAHTPFMIRWKGRYDDGVTIDRLVQNIDVAPTVLELCGAEPLPGMHLDGRSLVPLLEGKSDGWRDALYLEIGLTRGVVTKSHKYFAFREPPEYGESTEEERVAEMEQYYEKKTAREGRTLGFVDGRVARTTHLGMVPGGTDTEWPPQQKYPNYFDRDQLYDLSADPNEQKNLAGNPEYGELLRRMQDRLKAYLMDVPGPFGELKKGDLS